jgi:host factor-I protein
MSSEVSIQNQLLNLVRREHSLITVFLVSGKKFVGYVIGFDRYTVHLRCRDFDQIVFKHAITNISVPRAVMQRLPMAEGFDHVEAFQNSVESEELSGEPETKEEA